MRGLWWRVLHQPKDGHTEEEYEDAWAGDPAAGRFAVADGVSESAFAGMWARLLAEGFVAVSHGQDFSEWVHEARERWSAEVMDLKLPWYTEMKREEGAFATLLGLNVRPPTPDRPGRWRVDAVGDACLVRVRKDRYMRAFPLKRSSDFGNDPRLIGSRNDDPAPAPEHASGSLLAADRFFLMTDALAQWFLHSHESREKPWEAIASLLSAARPEEAFAKWIEELRSDNGLRNDDVTLLAVEINIDERESGQAIKE